MANQLQYAGTLLTLAFLFFCLHDPAGAEQSRLREVGSGQTAENASATWRAPAVENARIMSQVKWTPVADGMPMQWRGYFEKGSEYTGVPYSNQTHGGRTFGRTIGFEVFLKTFLAAVENPHSALDTYAEAA